MLHLKLGCMSLVLDSLLSSSFGIPVADGCRCSKPLEHATGCKFTKHVDIFGRFMWIVTFICSDISIGGLGNAPGQACCIIIAK